MKLFSLNMCCKVGSGLLQGGIQASHDGAVQVHGYLVDTECSQETDCLVVKLLHVIQRRHPVFEVVCWKDLRGSDKRCTRIWDR